MIAYHGKQEVKDLYLNRVRAHRAADELVKGQYWEDGKGCAVGCTIHGGDHAAYETELGIPKALAYLEDRIFESLPSHLAMEWPEKFLAAIKPGADLTLVISRFFHWLLVDPADGVIRFANSDQARAAIQGVADLYERQSKGEEPAESEWQAAYYAAYDVKADDSAYYADYDINAAKAAYYAAAVVVYDSVGAVSDAVSAVFDAAYYAAAAYVRQSDKLIELLEAA